MYRRDIETNSAQPLGLRWFPFVNRAVFLRAAIVAVVIGSVLTLINQSGWVVGSDPLQLLPFILVFVTPFVVVTISQVAAARRAFLDAVRHGEPASPEGLIATTISHGIPARAVVIGLTIASINAILILAGALLRSGDLATVSAGLLGQVYALPLLFGMLSQATSYRRAAHVVRIRTPVRLPAPMPSGPRELVRAADRGPAARGGPRSGSGVPGTKNRAFFETEVVSTTTWRPRSGWRSSSRVPPEIRKAQP